MILPWLLAGILENVYILKVAVVLEEAILLWLAELDKVINPWAILGRIARLVSIASTA